MHYYELGYWSLENNPSIILSNNKLYTKKQFHDLVSDLYIKVYNRDKEDFSIDDETGKPYEFNFDASNFTDEVIEELVKIGFNKLKVEQGFIPFGWGSIIDKEDWTDQIPEDDPIKLIRDKLNGQSK